LTLAGHRLVPGSLVSARRLWQAPVSSCRSTGGNCADVYPRRSDESVHRGPGRLHGLWQARLPVTRRHPHLPTQLTIEDAWFWKNDTLGAGWFIFLADGMSFPDPVRESRLLDVFLASLRARLPRGTTTLSSGFVWVAGDTRTPLTMSVVRLDVIGVRGRRQNATTVRSTQTFSFQ
jgi:hypothetical protein